MKKLMFLSLSVLVALSLSNCNKVDTTSPNYTPKEKSFFESLKSLGIKDVEAHRLMEKVIIPKGLLEIEKNEARRTAVKDGVWILCDCPGPGHDGGPIGDRCDGIGRKCTKSGAIVYHNDPVELAVFFPNLAKTDVVDVNLKYPEGHPYPQYLSLIYE